MLHRRAELFHVAGSVSGRGVDAGNNQEANAGKLGHRVRSEKEGGDHSRYAAAAAAAAAAAVVVVVFVVSERLENGTRRDGDACVSVDSTLPSHSVPGIPM